MGKRKSRMRTAGLAIGKWVRIGRQTKQRRPSFRKKKAGDTIRYPWKRTAKQVFQERKDRHEQRTNDNRKKLKLMRVKFPERHQPSTIGPGYPGYGLIYANMEIARGERERKVLKESPSGRPLIYEPLKTTLPHPLPDNVFEEFCRRIGIERYKIEEPAKEDQHALDLKPCDLYWEDMRIERNLILKQVKQLPILEPVEVEDLGDLEKSIFNVSRTCYYSPSSSHPKSEDVLHLMVWLLNRKNLPVAFHIKLLQAVSLVLHNSPTYKEEFVLCGGIRVLYRSLQAGLIICPLQACWAGYALTMAAIGSVEVIYELQQISDFDESVGELTFPLYWYYWPTNFACILQSLIFGPGGAANTTDLFDFM